jgi:hypothetical protein
MSDESHSLRELNMDQTKVASSPRAIVEDLKNSDFCVKIKSLNSVGLKRVKERQGARSVKVV